MGKILVVDDEIEACNALKEFLEQNWENLCIVRQLNTTSKHRLLRHCS